MSETKNTPNNNILYAVIIVLIIIVALLWGYLIGSKTGNTPAWNTNTPAANIDPTGKDVTVTVIDDTRCTNCNTDEIVSQIKLAPFLTETEFVEKDFADVEVQEFLKDNNITALPAVIFSTNTLNDGWEMANFMTPLPNGEFSLNIGSNYDPFIERSDKGFLLVDTQILSGIKAGSYVKGNPDAKITWIEYSDLECPFCARLHNATTIPDVLGQYGDDLNMIFQHYPLDFHANAKPGAQILECFGEQNGSEAFYSLIDKSFAEENSSRSFLIEEAVVLWGNKEALESCLSADTYSEKVDNQLQTGQEVFGVTGTPGNVLVNMETGEYEVISGAYPKENFISVIDRLLQ